MPAILARPPSVHRAAGPRWRVEMPDPIVMSVDERAVTHLQHRQAGVVSRRQVLDNGGTDSGIERLLRRREWARLHRGVYVDHTGPPSWDQQAGAAVLLHWPSALAGASALRAYGVGLPVGREHRGAVELVVSRSRRVDDPPGVRSAQLTRFEEVALMHLGPPRVRLEHAALTVASLAASQDGAVAVLGDVCQQRRTTAARLLTALEEQPRLPRRHLLRAVLGDVATGAQSALERRYLLHVERAHHLPRGRRQTRAVSGRGTTYRDVSYDEQEVIVELDGRLGHDGTGDRWEDLTRDLTSAMAGGLTLRAGWRQVLDACPLAGVVGSVLLARGWTGRPARCGRDCSVSSGSTLRSGEDPRRLVPGILA